MDRSAAAPRAKSPEIRHQQEIGIQEFPRCGMASRRNYQNLASLHLSGRGKSRPLDEGRVEKRVATKTCESLSPGEHPCAKPPHPSNTPPLSDIAYTIRAPQTPLGNHAALKLRRLGRAKSSLANLWRPAIGRWASAVFRVRFGRPECLSRRAAGLVLTRRCGRGMGRGGEGRSRAVCETQARRAIYGPRKLLSRVKIELGGTRHGD